MDRERPAWSSSSKVAVSPLCRLLAISFASAAQDDESRLIPHRINRLVVVYLLGC